MQNNQDQVKRDDVSSSSMNTNDLALHQRIMDAIHADSSIDSSNITIRMRENDMVEICGTVPESSMVQRAEDCVRRVEGVKGEIDTDLKVRMN